MKNRFILFTAALGVLLSSILLAPAASAQTASSRAAIPFAFSANNHALPSGSYTVVLRSDGFLTLGSLETGKMATLMVRTAKAPLSIAKGSLLFEKVGTKYRLTQVRFANADLESELGMQPKPEREIGRKENSAKAEIASR